MKRVETLKKETQRKASALSEFGPLALRHSGLHLLCFAFQKMASALRPGVLACGILANTYVAKLYMSFGIRISGKIGTDEGANASKARAFILDFATCLGRTCDMAAGAHMHRLR